MVSSLATFPTRFGNQSGPILQGSGRIRDQGRGRRANQGLNVVDFTPLLPSSIEVEKSDSDQSNVQSEIEENSDVVNARKLRE